MEKKSFYKSFFAMYVVLVLQNVISLSVNLADNLMLGSYSETALSGVAAVNQIQFVYQQLLMAVGDSAVILFVLVSLFPGKAMSFFTTDAAIAQQGMIYIRTIRLGTGPGSLQETSGICRQKRLFIV